MITTTRPARTPPTRELNVSNALLGDRAAVGRDDAQTRHRGASLDGFPFRMEIR